MKTTFPRSKTSSMHLFRNSTLALGLLCATAVPSLHAADGAWNVDNAGNWSLSSNWNPVAIPGGVGSTVNVANDITADRTVTIDSTSRTVGILNLGDASGSSRFFIARSGTAVLIFNSGTAADAKLNLQGGRNTISAPIQLATSLTIANSAGVQQTISGGISANTAGTFTFTNMGTGVGNVQINGNVVDGSGVIAVRQNSTTSALVMVGGGSTYTGGTILDAGLLAVEGSSPLGSGGLVINSGTFANNSTATTGVVTIANAVTLNGNASFIGAAASVSNQLGRLIFTGAMTLTGDRSISIAAANAHGVGYVQFLGGTKETGGSHRLTKTGAGLLDILVTNTGTQLNHTGGTYISSGTFRISSTSGVNAFGDNASVTVNGGTFDIASTNASSETIGTLNLESGSVIGSSGTAVLIADAFNLSSGSVSKALGGTGALSKLTSGTVTLTGSNSYTGATIVSAGKLLIDGNNSQATGAVTINGGVLGGSGIIGGAVTVNDGGMLAPGNSPGVLTVNNSISIQDGGSFGSELNGLISGTEYDRLVMGGGSSTLSLAGQSNFELTLGFNAMDGDLFFLIDNQGTNAISGVFGSLNGVVTNLTQGAYFTVDGQAFTISYQGDLASNTFLGGNDLVLQAVPEPGSVTLAGVTAGLALWGWRRRRVRKVA